MAFRPRFDSIINVRDDIKMRDLIEEASCVLIYCFSSAGGSGGDTRDGAGLKVVADQSDDNGSLANSNSGA